MITRVYDALVIGAGPAGLAAATTLVRQLQTALVLDSGVYRNARAEHLHGIPGFDHVDPAAFRTKAKGDILRRYDSVEFKKARITEIRKKKEEDGAGLFEAVDSAGHVYLGRKVVLATGVRDILPEDIEGFGACWGYGIFHCLFCHGFEERGGASAGLFAFDLLQTAAAVHHVSLMALNLAQTLRIYTNGDEAVADDIETNASSLLSAAHTENKQVTIERRCIKSVKMVSLESSDVLVTLGDGTEVRESFVAYHPLLELNGPFASQLGLEVGPQGEIVVSPPFSETSVRGVFAAGDAASATRIVMNAMAQGTGAAGGVVSQVLTEKAAAAAAAGGGD